MDWLARRRDYLAWKHAQKVHQLEHENGLMLTLPCEAVGHFNLIDEYHSLFDATARRRFLEAGGHS